ncbi:DUF2332 domain-containing protein [Sphingomonas sp. AP4-R1]|uniref:DUF2332 domain-containing protein n=1 Tax=Sphingomonas sp. AP4-R1 TaxID=2735134 RepID=UPI0014935195|nr:DUF2332 domain-containing protein [Sphingomonas sp. AP4-R1]QJU56784.1 DUF2332 domain-containing protein [Sphingomonas sp. AP4-R1]
MADEARNRESFRWQADFCAKSGMTIITRVCQGLADALDRTSRTGARVLDWPGEPIADALPLRLVGGLHALHRARSAPALAPVFEGVATEPAAIAAMIGATLATHDDELHGWLDGPPQTNEAARSGVLMTGLLSLAQRFREGLGTPVPFELLEIGSSAGLNLMIDRYGFDLGAVRVGPEDAPIRIAPEWRGASPPDVKLAITSVRGVDKAPIDLSSEESVERLVAYVWIDQQDRVERTGKAIAMAQADPPRLGEGDAADWVEARLAEPQPEGTARVLMHSIVWQYLTPEGQDRITAAMAAAGARATPDRPLGWIAYEGDRAHKTHRLTIRSWPGEGVTEDLGGAHPHGAWISWERD